MGEKKVCKSAFSFRSSFIKEDPLSRGMRLECANPIMMVNGGKRMKPNPVIKLTNT